MMESGNFVEVFPIDVFFHSVRLEQLPQEICVVDCPRVDVLELLRFWCSGPLDDELEELTRILNLTKRCHHIVFEPIKLGIGSHRVDGGLT